jgi:putative ABC transport system permease protein
MGMGTVIIGLAAVMIVEKLLSITSVPFSLLACGIGSILYRFLVAGALHGDELGLETSDLNLITGLLIVGIMMFPSFQKRRGLC